MPEYTAVDALTYWNKSWSKLDEGSHAWQELVAALHVFTSTDADVANAYSTGRADAEADVQAAPIQGRVYALGHIGGCTGDILIHMPDVETLRRVPFGARVAIVVLPEDED